MNCVRYEQAAFVNTKLLVSFVHSQLMLVKLQRNTYFRNSDS